MRLDNLSRQFSHQGSHQILTSLCPSIPHPLSALQDHVKSSRPTFRTLKDSALLPILSLQKGRDNISKSLDLQFSPGILLGSQQTDHMEILLHTHTKINMHSGVRVQDGLA